MKNVGVHSAWTTRSAARLVSSLLLATTLILPLCFPLSAPAVPLTNTPDTQTDPNAEGSPTVEEQVVLFESRIATLDTNLEVVSEEINTAKEALGRVRAEVARREGALTQTREAYNQSKELLAQQARAAYREGSASYLDILFSAKDIPSLLSKYDFINRTIDQQEKVRVELKEQKEQIESELIDLKKDELEAQAIEFELQAKEIEMKHRKAEYQALFDEANAKVVQGYQASVTRNTAADRKTLAEFLSGDYQVEPGSVVETLLSYRGIPYVWGGESKKGFDCSGLLLYAFAQHGVKLPHSSRMQSQMGTPVSVGQLQPGDAVFFGSPVHHVGVYLGGKYYIHAPRTGDVVKVSVLSTRGDYVGARRYGWVPRVGNPR